MQRFGKGATRVFKSLAGLDKEAPLTSFTIALYGLLFLVAMTLIGLWAAGWPAK